MSTVQERIEPTARPVITQAAPEPTIRLERFTFTGSGSEYFRIWIANLLLTIVTFGIYSAWAKVRRTRYFYDSTRVAGSSFEYHGEPVGILKGRLVAVAFLGLTTWPSLFPNRSVLSCWESWASSCLG
jgi:uncharacterized membrane protein YjgN (DUF898 family)